LCEQSGAGNHCHDLRPGDANPGTLAGRPGKRFDYRYRKYGFYGWVCSNTGMRRMRAAGTSNWGRAVLLIQLVGLMLAFMFGFFEARRGCSAGRASSSMLQMPPGP
jgi:hypothetical protein